MGKYRNAPDESLGGPGLPFPMLTIHAHRPAPCLNLTVLPRLRINISACGAILAPSSFPPVSISVHRASRFSCYTIGGGAPARTFRRIVSPDWEFIAPIPLWTSADLPLILRCMIAVLPFQCLPHPLHDYAERKQVGR